WQFTVPSVDEHRQLNRSHAAEVAKSVQRCSYGATGIKNIVDEHDIPIVDIRGHFRFLHDRLRRHTSQVIAIQVDVERTDLRFPLRLLCHPHGHSTCHGHAASLNTDEDDGTAVVCLQDLAGHPVQRDVHFARLHQLVIQLQRHGGSELYARLNRY